MIRRLSTSIASVFFAVLVLSGCGKQQSSTTSSTADSTAGAAFQPDSLIEQVVYATAGASVSDSIFLYRPHRWSDPGEFQRLRIHLGNGKSATFDNQDGWDSVRATLTPDCLSSMSSLSKVRSARMALLPTGPETYTVVLFGYQYADDPAKFSVIDVSRDSIRMVYNEEFQLTSISASNPGRRYELVGVHEFIEGWGSDSISFSNYVPSDLYSLPSMIRASKAQVRLYNITHGGFDVDADSVRYLLVTVNHAAPVLMTPEEASQKFGDAGGE